VLLPIRYIKRIHNTYGDRINICTVVGFPLGYNTTASKLEEVRKAEIRFEEILSIPEFSSINN